MTDAAVTPTGDIPPAAADEPTPAEPVRRRRPAGAFFVALGIFATKIFGIVRNSFIAAYLGTTGAADAFNAATRIPNLLQNLFGEGALSASFIPVYSRLRADGKEEDAGVVAGGVLLTLALVVAILVALGMLFTPQILPIFAGGLKDQTRAMAVDFVRIVFPGIGLLVLSAWCLGVLNSHRRFFLSYAAPVAWSVCMIAAFWYFGPRQSVERLARTATWAYVVGALAQLFVQVPWVVGLVRKHIRLSLNWSDPNVRTVLRNFVPVGISRGIVQLSNYVDILISSFLPQGTFSLITYATTISYVPVSLFGIGISAAELPEMSSLMGSADERSRQLRERLNAGLRHIAFFVIPSAAAMVAAGDSMAAALFEHGKRFSHQNSIFVWGILAGSAVGLLASTSGRLYSSTYYALHDTKTPLKFACIRVALTSVLGFLFAIPLPRLLGIDGHWGGAGLTASFGIAGWVEFLLLRHSLSKRIGATGTPASFTARLWIAAAIAGAACLAVKLSVAIPSHVVSAVLVLGTFGLVYLGATLAFKVPEATMLMRRLHLAR
jgi:putative peptidoglycan lipid II flippase